MSWIDDLQTKVEQATSGIVTDINTYINQRVVAPVIKIAQPQTGNLSAAQIAAGQKGGPVPIAAAVSSPSSLQNAASASQVSSGTAMAISVPVLLALGVGAFFLMKKGRG